MSFWEKKKKISDLVIKPSRDIIIKRSRILIVDDEDPVIIQSMKGAGFAVDHFRDIGDDNIKKIDNYLYDLIILDFGGVGSKFGEDEGLSLLKYIKRVAPATVIITYTSKSLSAKYSEFYQANGGVLGKDAGITESLEKIEKALEKAYSIDTIWLGLLCTLNIDKDTDKDLKLQDAFVRTVENKGQDAKSEFMRKIVKLGITKTIEKGVEIVISKLFFCALGV